MPAVDGRDLRRLGAGLAGMTVLAALTQMGREAVQERRGSVAPTYAATHVVDSGSHGREPRLLGTVPSSQPPTGSRAFWARLWAAPTTVAGLLLGALSMGSWSWNRTHGTFVVRGARSPLLAVGGFQANAIGHVIVSRPDPVPPRLLVHEAAHVRQAERLGPLTLPLYVYWLARHGYRNHPMERAARAATRAWLAQTATD